MTLEGDTFDGLVWRYIPAWSYPLHAGFLLLAAGRWNRYGVYGCLYTALAREGAVAEYEKVRALVGLAAADDDRKDLVSVRVVVRPVLDLTDAAMQDRYGVTAATLTGDDPQALETCRSIADLARAEGYRAILAPSAALAGGTNLIVYLEGRAADLRLRDGPDRVPLNY